ncbi:hypothetical protein TH61_05085 [Rufibacter sp. DG15C]|uniref:T9SS type A sorting domain-containing protein n=1 Tax=Rufibacter sp. DG15C TaxID=1379909 RepID=UPI00078CD249|nr:T9SS type A sorting domain-containing protein [Rufibacter sp. DG15C]AMM50675.1 hypothetical protein TH61_05085 [Rufibacter sp. DG15C]
MKKTLPFLYFFFLVVSFKGVSQQIDPNFNPKFEAEADVNSITRLSDGNLLAGGIIHTTGDKEVFGLVKINQDGTIDPTFKSEAITYNITTITTVEQPDKRILLGGSTSSFNNQGKIGISRLLADGTPDNSFISPLASGYVGSILVLPNGKILIGGNFTLKDNPTLRNIARLHADGAVDETFLVSSGANAVVKAIEKLPDGKFLVAGDFTLFNGSEVYKKLIRLLEDGSVDPSFRWDNRVADNNGITDVLLLPDGKIVFATKPKRSASDTGYLGIGCLNTDGSIFSGFTNTFGEGPSAQYYSTINTLALQNNRILVGGAITNIATYVAKSVMRLHLDGTLDVAFSPSPKTTFGVCKSMVVQPDNSIIIGGSLNKVEEVLNKGISKLDPEGNVQQSFVPDVKTHMLVEQVYVQKDGKLIVTGPFKFVNNTRVNMAARLNPDGSLDPTFTFGHLIGGSYPMAMQGDKIILLSPTESNLMRINYNGEEDPTFIKTPSISAQYLAVGPDGKIAVAGYINGKRFARLHANGTIDENFNAASNVTFSAQTIALQADGKILAGRWASGNFVQNPNDFVMRFNADGSLDESFSIGAGPAGKNPNAVLINSIVPDPNGNMLVAGQFDSFDGHDVSTTGALVLLNPTGKYLSSVALPGIDLGYVYDLKKETATSYIVASSLVSYGAITASGLVRIISNNVLAAPEEYSPLATTSRAYPNPFKESVNFENRGEQARNVTIRVVSLTGKELYKNSISRASASTKQSIPLGYLPDGVYILEIDAGGKKETQRIVKLNQ